MICLGPSSDLGALDGGGGICADIMMIEQAAMVASVDLAIAQPMRSVSRRRCY